MGSLLTRSGHPLCALGLASNPDMTSGCVSQALKAGINAFFFYNLSFDTLVREIKEVTSKCRDDIFIATGTESRDIGAAKVYFEQVQKALQVQTVDAFFVEYVAPGDSLLEVQRILTEIETWKKQGLVRHVGASVHDRPLALELIQSGQIDVLMHRYNMAHRKSEDEVLPLASKMDIPVVSFTNTRWGSLLKGHTKWQGAVPSAADCYRFVLRHPAVALAWTAPRSTEELQANVTALDAPRMTGDEVAKWKAYGDLIYGDGSDAFETRWP